MDSIVWWADDIIYFNKWCIFGALSSREPGSRLVNDVDGYANNCNVNMKAVWGLLGPHLILGPSFSASVLP